MNVLVISTIPNLVKKLEIEILKFSLENRFNVIDYFSNDNDVLNNSNDIIIADPSLLIDSFDSINFENTKWIHSTWAGNDKIIKNGQEKLRTIPLTRSGGSYSKMGDFMSEYVLSQIIGHQRKYLEMYDNQKKNIWNQNLYKQYKSLSDLSVMILGYGAIGSKIATVLKLNGVKNVTVVRKNVPEDNNNDEDENEENNKINFCKVDNINEEIKDFDYVVNVLPSTNETRYLFDKKKLLDDFKEDSVFINVGRGDIVSSDYLIDSLKERSLYAVLDVFEQEPLNEDSELWSLNNCIITPHVSCISDCDDIIQSFLNEYKSFIFEKKLVNVVDWNKGY